jgi:hypothetical protein
MPERPWQTLVRQLTDAGYESPYLDRLRARVDPAQAQDTLEQEIIREMASALGRAEDKLNAALLRLELAGRALAAAVDRGERRDRAIAFNAERTQALRARWELTIQREAVGMRRNDVLERLYPIPAAVTLDD